MKISLEVGSREKDTSTQKNKQTLRKHGRGLHSQTLGALWRVRQQQMWRNRGGTKGCPASSVASLMPFSFQAAGLVSQLELNWKTRQ